MDIVGRLIKFRDFTGLTSSQFADKASIPRPTLSQFMSGRNKRLSDDLANKIHLAFPELNMMWLLFGEGDMVIESNIQFSEAKNDVFSAIEHDYTPDLQPSQETTPLFQDDENLNANRNSDSKSDEKSPVAPVMPPNLENCDAVSSLSASMGTSGKRIQSIIVFYTDNSFEIFKPGNK